MGHFYFDLMLETIACSMAMMMAKMAAGKNPSASKPSIIFDTSRIINTEIIKETRPNVRKLMGKVRIRKINPTVAFAKEIRNAAMIASHRPSTCIPGLKYAPTITIAPIIRMSANILNISNRFKVILGFLMLLFSACSNKDIKKELIYFNADSTKIVLEIPEIEARNFLGEILKADSLSSDWVTVVRSGEEELEMEEELQGSVLFNGEALIFTPAKPFQKGDTYLVETAIGTSIGGYTDAFKNDLKIRGERTSKTLIR